jgi:hypothetical protein
MKHTRALYSVALLLVLFSLVLGTSKGQAAPLKQTTSTPTWRPLWPSSTPRPTTDYSCYQGTPEGWGTYTPDPYWSMYCKECNATGTPSPAPSITPTLQGGTPHPTLTVTPSPSITPTVSGFPANTKIKFQTLKVGSVTLNTGYEGELANCWIITGASADWIWASDEDVTFTFGIRDDADTVNKRINFLAMKGAGTRQWEYGNEWDLSGGTLDFDLATTGTSIWNSGVHDCGTGHQGICGWNTSGTISNQNQYAYTWKMNGGGASALASYKSVSMLGVSLANIYEGCNGNWVAPTPTPEVTPKMTWCGAVQPDTDTELIELPIPLVGPGSCFTVPAVGVPEWLFDMVDGVFVELEQADYPGFPGFRVCLLPITFGYLGLLGFRVFLDGVGLILAAIATIRILTRM